MWLCLFRISRGCSTAFLNTPMIASRVNCVGKIPWNPNISQPVGWCRMTIRQVAAAPHRLLCRGRPFSAPMSPLGDSTWLNHIAPYPKNPKRFSIRSYHTINVYKYEPYWNKTVLAYHISTILLVCWHMLAPLPMLPMSPSFPRRCCSHPSRICWRWWTPRCSSAVLRNRPQSAGWFFVCSKFRLSYPLVN